MDTSGSDREDLTLNSYFSESRARTRALFSTPRYISPLRRRASLLQLAVKRG
jgi:hypothetical protein